MIAPGTLRLAAADGVAVPVSRAGAMSEADEASFHTARPRLFGIASRVLGSASDADDVVQETWIRWQGTDRSRVRDSTAFLATTATRLAINVGQSARARRETTIGQPPVEPVDTGADSSLRAEQREALGLAMRTLLEKLSPTERAVYVLREAFDYPFREIAEILTLSEVNARQLLTRARRRLTGDRCRPVRTAEQESLLDAFVAAAQTGDIATLEQLLAAHIASHSEVVDAARGPVSRGVPAPRRRVAPERCAFARSPDDPTTPTLTFARVASVSREAAQRLGKSKAVVDYKEYAGRPHFTAGAPGWEAVADYALDWANRHVGAPAETAEAAA